MNLGFKARLPWFKFQPCPLASSVSSSSPFSFCSWNIIALQCRISVYCTIKGISYMYIYIPSPQEPPSHASHPTPLSSVQSVSRVRLFVTPWTAVRQASLSITSSRSLLKLMSIESVMLSSHLLLCHPLLLLSRSSQNTKLNSLWCRASHWLSILHVVVYIYRRRRWHPTPVFLPGKSHGQRSLVGCSPWGR